MKSDGDGKRGMVASNYTLDLLLRTAEECKLSYDELHNLLKKIEERHEVKTSDLKRGDYQNTKLEV